MRTLTISSLRGGSLDLLNNDYFILINFEGETSTATSLGVATIPNFDGDVVNSRQAMPRTALLELYIKENVEVETAKRQILQVIKPKQECTFHAAQDGRDITLTGIVESVNMPRYQNGIIMQCTFHCSQPFWEDFENVVNTLSDIKNLHYFSADENDMLYFTEEGMAFGEFDFSRQRTFYNGGDVAVGMTIRITAIAPVTNPKIYAVDGSFIGVNATMKARDIIEITTGKGYKTATKNGVNILNDVIDGSTWLQMETGYNTFNIVTDDENTDNCYFELIYKQRYV